MLSQTQFCLFLRRWNEKRGKFILQVIEIIDNPCLSLLVDWKSDSYVAGGRGVITTSGEGRKVGSGDPQVSGFSSRQDRRQHDPGWYHRSENIVRRENR